MYVLHRFVTNGKSNLIMDPRPPLVSMLETNPYDDPANPPLQPDQITGYCAMQWQDEVDSESGRIILSKLTSAMKYRVILKTVPFESLIVFLHSVS